MSRAPSKDEWLQAIAEEFNDAVKAVYEGEIEAAVKAEREACMKICEKEAENLPHGSREWIVANLCAVVIGQRGQK